MKNVWSFVGLIVVLAQPVTAQDKKQDRVEMLSQMSKS
jgi:hypothetical protein